MNSKIPIPAINRLCAVYQLLCDLHRKGLKKLSSSELASRTGLPPHTIRKDISYLGEIGSTGMGYDIQRLKNHIFSRLGLAKKVKVCIVGLGRLGLSILESPMLADDEFTVAAGFDSNINKLETLRTSVPVFPSHEITDVVRRIGIQLGIIAVTPENAQNVADRLVEGGVEGIVNFAPVVINPGTGSCIIRNIDLAGELRILSALRENRRRTKKSKSRQDQP